MQGGRNGPLIFGIHVHNKQANTTGQDRLTSGL